MRHLEKMQIISTYIKRTRSALKRARVCFEVFARFHELLAGEVILVEGTETLLTAGDIACWPASHPVGHHLESRSTAKASYLTIGTRKTKDVIHYPDHKLISHKDGDGRRYTHADGRPFDSGAKHD